MRQKELETSRGKGIKKFRTHMTAMAPNGKKQQIFHRCIYLPVAQEVKAVLSLTL